MINKLVNFNCENLMIFNKKQKEGRLFYNQNEYFKYLLDKKFEYKYTFLSGLLVKIENIWYNIGVVNKNDDPEHLKPIKWRKNRMKRVVYNSEEDKWEDLLDKIKLNVYDLLIFNDKMYKPVYDELGLADIIGQADVAKVFIVKNRTYLSLMKDNYEDTFEVRKLTGVYNEDTPPEELLKNSKVL